MSHVTNTTDINIIIQHINTKLIESTDLHLYLMQLNMDRNILRNMKLDSDVQQLATQNEKAIILIIRLKHNVDNDIALHRDILADLRMSQVQVQKIVIKKSSKIF